MNILSCLCCYCYCSDIRTGRTVREDRATRVGSGGKGSNDGIDCASIEFYPGSG